MDDRRGALCWPIPTVRTGLGLRHVYAEVDPKTNDAHYRVELLVGIRVRGRPGYPIKGAYGLGRAELRSGALAPKRCFAHFALHLVCTPIVGRARFVWLPLLFPRAKVVSCASLGPMRPL